MKKILCIVLSFIAVFQTAVSAKDYSEFPQRFWDLEKIIGHTAMWRNLWIKG